MNDQYLNLQRASELWNKTKEKIAGATLQPGDGLSRDEGKLNVITPVEGIFTESEFEALPESDKNKGFYIIDDGLGCEDVTYSTEETRIGTWIDGKPLYRVVWNLVFPAAVTASDGYDQLHAAIPNASVKMIRVYASMYNDIWESIPAISLSGLLTKVFYSDKLQFWNGFPSGLSVHVQNPNYLRRPLVAILEYTKTTESISTITVGDEDERGGVD